MDELDQEIARLKKRKTQMMVVAVLMPLLLFWLGTALGHFHGTITQRLADMHEAVDKGHAEIYFGENGEKMWRWLPNETRRDKEE